MYHEHPLRILRYSMKNIWLLIFPLLRGISVLHFNASDLYEWWKGAWFDIAVLFIILIFGFVRWFFSRITVNERSVVYRQGIFIRIHKAVPISCVSVTTAEYPFYLKPFKGVIISLDTRAGVFKNADLKIMVREKVCREIMSFIPESAIKGKKAPLPKANALSVVGFSVFFSSGFSGFVYIATFFYKGGDIVQDMISSYLSRITETTEMLTNKLFLKIPDAAIAVGTFFITAWFLSFIVNLLRYSKFRISGDEEVLNISCGLLKRREYRIKCNHINYTDLRQNLIMKIAGAVSVSISCAGYGADSQHLPVLLPIRMEKNLGKGLENLGIRGNLELNFRPKFTSWLNYNWQPLFTGLLFIPARKHFEIYISGFSDLSQFTLIMVEIACIWFIAIRTTALFTNGISVYDDTVVFRCSKGTSFHTLIADRDNVVKTEIRQTLLQKISGKCSVCLWFSGEMRSRYVVRALNKKDVIRIAEAINYNS